jgi:glycosyltransferase involved in cell wall biosynthesis
VNIERIIWILVHPTPYNIYLLNELLERLPVPSEAVYRWETLPSHPWGVLPDRRFPWQLMMRGGGPGADLRDIAARDRGTLFIFAGWRDRSIAPLLARRWRAGLPFAFWMDTPRITDNLVRRAAQQVLVLIGRRAAAMLATGRPAIEAFVRMGFDPEHVLDFPFVVDPAHFAPANDIRADRRLAAAQEPMVRFLQCGRLIDRLKGQRVALEALSIAQRKVPGTRLELWISGSGPDRKVLEAAARALHIDDSVRFLGWTDYGELPALFAQADALVMPSHWDPFPVTVIEAMVAGLPILGSRACGTVVERVEHGRTGWIHEPGDARSLAAHMLELAHSSERLPAMGREASAASQDWGVARCADTLSSLLRGSRTMHR